MSNFLQCDEVLKGLNIEAVKTLQKTTNKSEREVFDMKIQLSKLIGKSIEWYNSPEGKVQRELSEITWNVSDMAKEVYNLGKTQLYTYNKVCKALNENKDILKEYTTFVRNEKRAGESEVYSLKGFIRYVAEETAAHSDEDKPEILIRFAMGKGKDAIKFSVLDNSEVQLHGNAQFDVENALLDALEKLTGKAYSETEATIEEVKEELELA